MQTNYDLIVIGAGISACTFASTFNKRFPDSSILLVEQGRRIGGRATSRKTRKNISFEFDHGLPSISLTNNISKDLKSLIIQLLNTKKLIDISNEILIINEFGEIDNYFNNQKIYRGYPFMINLCNGIINQSFNSRKINFLFNTFINKVKLKSGSWELKTHNQITLRSKKLILSSSLLVHPRCLDIINIDRPPIQDAFVNVSDYIVDAVIKKTKKQKYIKKKNYILLASSPEIVNNFRYDYLQLMFSNSINEEYSFERIIFQRQPNSSIIIILHCSYYKEIYDIDYEVIIEYLMRIFQGHKIFSNLFIDSQLINKMNWRASQPIGNLLPKEFQWSSISEIGFCGDWIDIDGVCGVQAAMESSIRLAKLIN
tara:strand:+ start:1334 stop:2443 length:1110 start_codon:yes stop_codon:yes gene_type:complete